MKTQTIIVAIISSIILSGCAGARKSLNETFKSGITTSIEKENGDVAHVKVNCINGKTKRVICIIGNGEPTCGKSVEDAQKRMSIAVAMQKQMWKDYKNTGNKNALWRSQNEQEKLIRLWGVSQEVCNK
jgi:major membrane immunogen (membrane-anchored lipoprotein)